MEVNNLLKVLIIGPLCVGKTALLERFLHEDFTLNQKPTIGFQYGRRQMKNNFGMTIILEIWDTAGAERFQSITSHYYRGAKAAILCFDLSDVESLNRLNFWVEDLNKTTPNCKKFLCGCKKDLPQSVGIQTVSTLIEELNTKYFETSSKTGEGINEIFQTVCNDVSESEDFLKCTKSTRNTILKIDDKKSTSIFRC